MAKTGVFISSFVQLNKQCFTQQITRTLATTHGLACPKASEKSQKENPGQSVRKSRVKSFAVKIYLGFVDRYVQKFEKRFAKRYPKAFKIYRLFKDGVSLFFKDSKAYYQVASGLWYGGKNLKDFSYQQLQVYRQMPSDMLRVAPVLIISLLPFANYVVFPVAYMFPRHLLCRHFWTKEQQVEFGSRHLEQRCVHHSRIHKLLVRECQRVKDEQLKEGFNALLNENHSGEMLTPSGSEVITELLKYKPLFERRLSLERLYSRHPIHMQWHVASSWGFPGRRAKLIEQATLLLHTDQALSSHGVDKLNFSELQQACFYRGVNSSFPSEQQMQYFLHNWLLLSTQVTGSTLSLLLHAPTVLGFQHLKKKS